MHGHSAIMHRRVAGRLRMSMARASTATATSSWTLCVDFDDTCSVRDTTADLARLARTGSHPQTSEVWDTLVAQFLQENADVMATIHAGTDTQQPSFQPHLLDAFLRAYSAADLRSVDRVVASRVLAGLPRASIVNRVDLKPDCARVLSAWRGHVVVLSSNWSQTSVSSALADVANARQLAGLPFAVHANELEFDDTDVSTGNLILPFKTPQDKANWVHQHRHAFPSNTVAYVGDGINDLPALLAADVGIVFNARGSSVFKVAAHAGVSIVETPHAVAAPSEAARPTLYQATSWEGVHDLLLASRFFRG